MLSLILLLLAVFPLSGAQPTTEATTKRRSAQQQSITASTQATTAPTLTQAPAGNVLVRSGHLAPTHLPIVENDSDSDNETTEQAEQ